jgi:5-methylcytosine-specific restriction endonuclease McrA
VASVPGPTEQVAFLRDLQRLLDEGQFVATYKFALLLSLADLAVELGDDSGAPLPIAVSSIAERFILLYWGHVRPFPGESDQGAPALLSQNLGRNIALLRGLAQLQERHPTVAEARRSRGWSRLVNNAERILRGMPLFRLQTLRSGAREFLYENELKNGAIVLNAGVAFHLRHFYVLIQHLIRGAWVRHIRSNPRNSSLLGSALDLEEFLFENRRSQYPRIKETLRDIQHGKCFYCMRTIRDGDALDHFIPWSKYPSDLGHNFVLADRACNADKSDLLAEIPFRNAWEERNESNTKLLTEAFTADAVPHDLAASKSIADWAYAMSSDSGAVLWAPQ